jgi:DNA-binding HxlR family transcriptional regulator/putative sterol carrier protein
MKRPKGDPKRTYNQLCPLARSLDILGERWTLLIVRNLLVGPQRYTDLLEGLPGIGTNLLSARLKDLETEGLVARRMLAPPAASIVYELTELGWGLEEPVVALGRWGMWTLRKKAFNPEFRSLWAVGGLRAVFRPNAATGVHETYELRIGDEVFHARVDDSALVIGHGEAQAPDLVMSCDEDTWRAISSLEITPADAAANGRLRFDGSPAALAHFARVFAAPTAEPRASRKPNAGR